jgi:NAD(P)-dependent dehydrogenase (short-subunit alcohol dehydrogenase family)
LEFSRRGAKVVLSGRNRQKLEEVALQCPGALVVDFDATDRDACHAAVSTIVTAWGGLDTVFLNAGTCEYVDVDLFDARMIDRVFAANFHSMTYCIEAVLPVLRQGNLPHLVGMSSTVAWGALPRAQAYGASKAAISYLFNSLGLELRPRGIAVSVVYPGFVKTPLTDRNDFAMPMRVTAEQAATAIANGVENRLQEIDFPKLFAWIFRLLAILPHPLYNAIASRFARST